MFTHFESLPSRLKTVSSLEEIHGVPCLLVRADETPRPFLLWMHGRTAFKEIDPGRFLRCIRSGINVCAVDLPGHGQRLVAESQGANRILPVVQQMASEIDGLLCGLDGIDGFDVQRAAIGGMSAGGMAAITRCLSPHSFKALVLEATCGDWSLLKDKPMCAGLSEQEFRAVNPIEHLNEWANIPVISFHSEKDEWIPFNASMAFLESLKTIGGMNADIEIVQFEQTGAPYEHIGFGRQSLKVKDMQVAFLIKHLQVSQEINA